MERNDEKYTGSEQLERKLFLAKAGACGYLQGSEKESTGKRKERGNVCERPADDSNIPQPFQR